MLYSALLVLMGSTFLMLRLGPGGTFPRPLTKEEENRCVERWVEQGDLEARNTLIEHNLRLVAHVIKKYYSSAEDMDAIHAIIFTELCIGKISEPSRQKLQEIIENLQARGAEGILLGCTELDMLIHPSDVSLPLFDTTVIHAKKAAHIAMEEQFSSTNFKAI